MTGNEVNLISFDELFALALSGDTTRVRIRGEVQGVPTGPRSGWVRMELVDTVGELDVSLRSLPVLCDASTLEQVRDGDVADVVGSLRLENSFTWLFTAQRIRKAAGHGRLAAPTQRDTAQAHPDLCREAQARLGAGRRAPKRLPSGLPTTGRLTVRWVGPISHHARKDVQGHLPERVQSDWRQVSFYNPSAIAEAISDSTVESDVIVVYRGGGGWRDWLPLNDVRVLNAVAQSPVPVVTAIGHETTDVTLSWLSAGDFGTPTEVRKAFGALAYPRANAADRPVIDQNGILIEKLRSDLKETAGQLRQSASEILDLQRSSQGATHSQIFLAQSFALYRIRARGVRQGILSLLVMAVLTFVLPVALSDRPWWAATGAVAVALVAGCVLAAVSFGSRRRALRVPTRSAGSTPEPGSDAWFAQMRAVRSPREYRRRRAF